jgi:glycosyltransferase involved in cell wall biosynthesis
MSTPLPASPRVSVVIPAYNNARDIEATLHSVLRQDYDDFEVVIADHSSTDGTADVIARFSAVVPKRTGRGCRRMRVASFSSFSVATI